MKKTLVLTYGVVSYALFFAGFLYLVGFLGNLVVPRSIDAAVESPLGMALAVNLGLVALFGLQHSGMARQGFKRWWTRIVPRPIERSTYVLITTAILALTYWQWRTMPGSIWHVEDALGASLLWTAFGAGWGLILVSTFVIDHFDLFGLKQVWRFSVSRDHADPAFKVALLYKLIRHPLYLGWLMVFWATPSMTVGHLLYAVGMSAYIFIAIQLEERDLVTFHGRAYVDYRRETPMFVPRRKGRRVVSEVGVGSASA